MADEHAIAASKDLQSTDLVRTFSTMIAMMGRGAFDGDLTDSLKKITEALKEARDNGAALAPKGELVLTLKLQLQDNRLEIHGTHKLKHPPRKPNAAVFWTTRDNHLAIVDTAQLDMFRGGPRPVRMADDKRPVASVDDDISDKKL